VKHLEAGYALHAEVGELPDRSHAAALLIDNYAHLGEFERAHEATERALQAGRACHDLPRQWNAHYWSGLASFLQGDWHSASQAATGSLTYARGVENMFTVSVAGSVVAHARFMLGDHLGAIAMLEEMAQIAKQGTIFAIYGRVLGPLALCYAEVGRSEESLQAAESCLRGCARTGRTGRKRSLRRTAGPPLRSPTSTSSEASNSPRSEGNVRSWRKRTSIIREFLRGEARRRDSGQHRAEPGHGPVRTDGHDRMAN